METLVLTGIVLASVVVGGIVVALAAYLIIRCSNDSNDTNDNKLTTTVSYSNHHHQQEPKIPYPEDTNESTYVSYREQSEDMVDDGQSKYRPPSIDPEELRGPGFKYNLPQRFQKYTPKEDQPEQHQQDIWRQNSHVHINHDRRRNSYIPPQNLRRNSYMPPQNLRQNSYMPDNNIALSRNPSAPNPSQRHSISVPYIQHQRHQQHTPIQQSRQKKEEELLYFRLTTPTDYFTPAAQEHNRQQPRIWPSPVDPLPRPHKYHTHNKEPDPAWIANNYWI
ncbi:hypothetical protein Pmani_007639 [Petrolisthes manimaculis]|uniref:Uncharacterized protein n=1 Tax=Petrolisthes manimaculis TaxID=1843537 RepID=A0AAE1Q855_9EUCA|nr:hypothetical protein Pmani_007639 [Petrolisthes manimaculis]